VAVVTHNLFSAQKMYDDLVHLLGEEDVWLYPVNDLTATEISVASPELLAQRMEVMQRLATERKGVYIFPIASLRRFVTPKSLWLESQCELAIGMELDLPSFLHRLIAMGYERTAMVEGPGQVSVRGGIIDIYPMTEENPYRIELFDTEIDAIRTFHADTQRSIANVQKVQIPSATEYILTEEVITKGIATIQERLGAAVKRCATVQQAENLTKNIREDIEKIEAHQKTPNVFKYMGVMFPKNETITSYLTNATVVFFDEMARIHELSEQLEREEAEWIVNLLDRQELLVDTQLAQRLPQVLASMQQRKVYATLFARPIPNVSPQAIISTSAKTMQEFFGKFDMLKLEVERWISKGYTVVLLTPNDERVKKLATLLEEHQISHRIASEGMPLYAQNAFILQGDLQQGFEYPALKLAVLTERELFNKKAKSTT
ncbi:MAG: transcription-repair coupling factor, partial [Bacilli bacterium]